MPNPESETVHQPMTRNLTRERHHGQTFTWSLLPLLIVHVLSHSPLDLLAHTSFFRSALPGYHTSGRQCVHTISSLGTEVPLSATHERTAPPGACDELAGTHTATFPAPNQTANAPLIALTLLSVRSDTLTQRGRFLSLLQALSSSPVFPLYLQHTALLI